MENILEFISDSFKSNNVIKKLNFAIKYEKELNIPHTKIIGIQDIHNGQIDCRIYPLNYLRYILLSIDNKIKDENSEKIKNLYNKELLQSLNEKNKTNGIELKIRLDDSFVSKFKTQIKCDKEIKEKKC